MKNLQLPSISFHTTKLTSNSILLIILIPSILVQTCSSPTPNKKPTSSFGILPTNLDTTTRPGDDFFQFANGGWLAQTTIPDEFGSWGSFRELIDHNNRILKEALKKAAQSQEFPEGTDQRKAIDFYQLGMDSLAGEKSGMKSIQPILDQIDRLMNRNDLQNFLVKEDLMQADAFFNFNVAPDARDSKKMAAYLGTGGIGMLERDYYLRLDAKSIETRETYRQHIATLLNLAGWDVSKSKKSADRIILLETDLARATLTKEEKRNPQLQYNKRSIADLATLLSTVNWTAYLAALEVKVDSIIVTEPNFLKGCDRILSNYPMDDIKAYLRWTVIRGAAPYLNNAFVRESFLFNSKYLLGAQKMLPRWKRILASCDLYLGDALGKLYVANAFPPEAREKAKEMVDHIRFAFAERIKGLDWMSDSTKKLALIKLSAITVKIGYPDKWKNYSGLIIERSSDRGSYYENILNARNYQAKERIDLLGKPVDKTVWDITPQTVNAYYKPEFNEIVFPAGILQPPFYDYRADEAVNYGGIGGAIGHEISHGFDDHGAQYDAEGNLKNWWGSEDLRKFKLKTKALAEQFDKYQPLPGLFVQGQFTLGENIGDLGGLAAAYDGLHRYFRETNSTQGLIDGLSPEQRFFTSWATIWRSKYRDAALRAQVLTNPHSPAMYRASGPPSNMVEFYQAFGVKPGDKMYRVEQDRIRIW